LAGNSLKMLVGYPVDGSVFGDASIIPGKMYQTDPQPYSLTLATDPINNQQVYIAPWFLSYPGNSGGPLYVQYNGYYYPAGVYLGTLYNGAQPYASLVRAIDTNVVRLITLAAQIGNFGTNNDGGVIRFLPDATISGSNPGWVQFDIEPPAAYAAGARWRFQGGPDSTDPNFTRTVTDTNAITVEFIGAPGWSPPPSQTVTVHPKAVARYPAIYTPIQLSGVRLLPGRNIAMTLEGGTGRVYSIVMATNLLNPISNWAEALRFTNTLGRTTFTNQPPDPSSQRYYRAKEL